MISLMIRVQWLPAVTDSAFFQTAIYLRFRMIFLSTASEPFPVFNTIVILSNWRKLKLLWIFLMNKKYFWICIIPKGHCACSTTTFKQHCRNKLTHHITKSFFSGVKGIDCISRMNGDDYLRHWLNDAPNKRSIDIYRGSCCCHTNADIFPLSIFETISIPSHHLPGLTLIVHKIFFLVGAAWDETVVRTLSSCIISFHCVCCM